MTQDDQHHNREELLLRAEEKRIRAAQRNLKVNRAVSSIYYLIGALEILLFLRILLRLTRANADNILAQLVYGVSSIFVAPFTTLFTTPATDAPPIFDLSAFVAMPMYAILGWLVAKLVKVIWETPS
ncbi:MAG: YggT family protein [Merismopedia sp. SIO2A8]|nr:YggT family protein [Symploca sp. SIO2B6]NET49231.1 YggT family protein [Merismopedia sp. SIO2A8]